METPTLPMHEQLLLLVLDEEGTTRSSYADRALAGAMLLDLLRSGVAHADRDQVTVASRPSPAAGVLADAARVIADESRARGPRWWVDQLPRRMQPFLPRVADRLVGSGVLTEQSHRVLGLFPTTRLPARQTAPGAEVRERLRAVLLGERPPEPDDAILAGLIAALDLVGAIVDRSQVKEAKRRARELGDSVVGDAVGQAIKSAEDAVTAAVIAATTAA
ncbi:MAG: GPP34 family phosphoprotein, partial [Candidatus Dormiibacterota bacterium]